MKFTRKRGLRITAPREKRICVDPFCENPPELIVDLVNYLSLNKISAEHLNNPISRKDHLQAFVNTYLKSKKVPWENYDPSFVVGTLKHFLANLPYPLLTNQLMECFMMTINESTDATSGKTQYIPSLEAIRSTIQMLPTGHHATLLTICRVFHQQLEHSLIKSEDLANCFAYELCNAKPFSAEIPITTDVLKARKLLETLVEKYLIVFEQEEIEDNHPLNRTQKELFETQLRQSTQQLRAHLETDKQQTDDISVREISTESTISPSRQKEPQTQMQTQTQQDKNWIGTVMNNKYMCISLQTDELLRFYSPYWQECTLMIMFVLCSFIPLLVQGIQLWLLCIPVVVSAIVALNFPLQDVWEFNLRENQVTKESKLFFQTKRKLVFDLSNLDACTVEEHCKMKGSYRVLLHFKSGEKIPLTESFYYSPGGQEQHTIMTSMTRMIENK